MTEEALIKSDDIRHYIYTIRDKQVMMDEDLASFYGIETKVLNQAVKRNHDRFPEEFMFQITDNEYNSLRSQFVTSNQRGGRRYLPYAFSEQGVAMLSAVLRSDEAVEISIQIIKAFVGMRRFFATNAQVFQRLDKLELKQLETDKKIDHVLDAIENKDFQPKQGIFFDGQVFDAYKFVSDLVRTAKESVILIDNFIDDSVLTLLCKKRKNVKVTILTRSISDQMILDVKRFNKQYPPIEIKEFKDSHDRFIVIDNSEVYHLGASLKDLGKKWFAFSKMDIGAVEMLARLDGMKL